MRHYYSKSADYCLPKMSIVHFRIVRVRVFLGARRVASGRFLRPGATAGGAPVPWERPLRHLHQRGRHRRLLATGGEPMAVKGICASLRFMMFYWVPGFSVELLFVKNLTRREMS